MVEPSRLAALPIFSQLTEEERTGIASYVDAVEVPAGERIASEGDFAYEFFVVESGTAEVQKQGSRVAELGPGDFFGELGLLVTGRRTADVVASSPMSLIAMFDRNLSPARAQPADVLRAHPLSSEGTDRPKFELLIDRANPAWCTGRRGVTTDGSHYGIIAARA